MEVINNLDEKSFRGDMDMKVYLEEILERRGGEEFKMIKIDIIF